MCGPAMLTLRAKQTTTAVIRKVSRTRGRRPPGRPQRRRLEASPPTMSATWNLHCLYSLDPSSPVFLRRLHSLFRYDEEERYLISLQRSELIRLLDFLDRVCTFLSALRPATIQVLQTLGVISSSDDISIPCLHKLQAICGHHATLPSSYFASSEIIRTGDSPIVVGGISDVWGGTYRNKTVYIERLKVSLSNDQARKKVRVWYVRKTICSSTQERP